MRHRRRRHRQGFSLILPGLPHPLSNSCGLGNSAKKPMGSVTADPGHFSGARGAEEEGPLTLKQLHLVAVRHHDQVYVMEGNTAWGADWGA